MLSSESRRLRIAQHAYTDVSRVLAALALFLFAGFRYGEPTWLLPSDIMIAALAFAAIFLVTIAAHAFGSRSFPLAPRAAVPLAVATALAAATAGLLTANDFGISKVVLLYEIAILLALVFLNYSVVRPLYVTTINLAAVAVAIAPSLTAASISSLKENVLGVRGVSFDTSTIHVITSRHDVRVVNKTVLDGRSGVNGGGLAALDDRWTLLATGDGDIHAIGLTKDELRLFDTSLRVPINREDYLRGAAQPSASFRVTDIFVLGSDTPRPSLLAAHHHWDVERRCVTHRLSEQQFDPDSLLARSDWVTRYESSPCISGDNLSTENGGRIELLSPGSILLTLGSNKLELLEADLAFLDHSSYGKIIELDTKTWAASVFSRGHRNPQGLLIADGVVWSTEHGPFGGDELNLVKRGADYGWPRSTYGTAYGGKTWPMIEGPHEHSVGTPPVYAWVPSIGVSNLIQMRGAAFPAWRGDLMVGSLSGLGNGQSLYRVKVMDARVVFAERIVTGMLVRDLMELADGRLLLWEGLTTLQLVEPAAHVFGACAACHAVRYNNHGVGPDLMGIVGERVAHWQDFPYSDALESFGGRWTTERLDAFLRDPRGTVPGTKMEMPGIEDPAQRAAIIEYLVEASRRQRD